MDIYQMVILGTATSASALIANSAAIGSGIFLLPVLSLVLPPKVALGIGAPVMLASNIAGIRNYWKEWADWREILNIIVTATLGIVLGAYFIDIIPNDIFKLAIGVFATSFALFHLGKMLYRARHVRAAPVAPVAPVAPAAPAVDPGRNWIGSGPIFCAIIGFAGGLATVLAHAGGVVWSTYYVRRKLSKRSFVATLNLLFALTNLFKTFAYMQIGILSLESTLIVLALFPVIILGSQLGNVLNRTVRPELFRAAVLLLILAAGVSLAVR